MQQTPAMRDPFNSKLGLSRHLPLQQPQTGAVPTGAHRAAEVGISLVNNVLSVIPKLEAGRDERERRQSFSKEESFVGPDDQDVEEGENSVRRYIPREGNTMHPRAPHAGLSWVGEREGKWNPRIDWGPKHSECKAKESGFCWNGKHQNLSKRTDALKKTTDDKVRVG